jgi:hypothetical protein
MIPAATMPLWETPKHSLFVTSGDPETPTTHMTKKLLFVLTIMLVFAFGAMAADISGRWTAGKPGRQGGAPSVTTFNFKVDGSKLTGDMTSSGRGSAAPTPIAIQDGKITGNTISFSVSHATPNGVMKSDYKGTINGNTIHLETTGPGKHGTPMPIKMALKRSTT